MFLDDYRPGLAYDEMFESGGAPRWETAHLLRRLAGLPQGDLQRAQRAADVALRQMGITFAVQGHEHGVEKVWPFDIVPRVIDGGQWESIELGLKQRIRALNMFVDDVYHEQMIVRDRVVPEELLATAPTFRRMCVGFRPPAGVWIHITGTDLVRDRDGQFYVLEDNLRCPSGVSYVLENREVMKRTIPRVFQGMSVAPVENYPERLLATLLDTAPEKVSRPTAVLLTPGVYNSAYFEHSFLAQQMGVEVVEGPNLMVTDGHVYMRTTRGPQRVDVIYRRIDDDFLDPLCFRRDSLLGVPGLMEVYRAGRVTLANAPGTGVADDKAVYAYVPAIIRYYLKEEPILPNVPTYVCWDDKQRDHVLANLDSLVVKPTNESGGYGIMIGTQATAAEQSACDRVRANPRGFIAQPVLTFSTAPTMVEGKLEPRHVDLRPFILYGKDIYVLPGGLTRVALRRGSLIVNSSQGGGSKDTWVLRRQAAQPDLPDHAARNGEVASC